MRILGDTETTSSTDAISQQDKQLAEVNSTLQSLVLAKQDGTGTEADRLDEVSQVATDVELLKSSMALLRDLLSNIEAAAANAGLGKSQMDVRFGDHNNGQQIGSISGGTLTNNFGGWRSD